MIRNSPTVTISLLVAMALGGCSDSPGSPSSTTGAKVRLLHGAAAAPALDLAIDGKVVVSGVRYQEESALADAPIGTKTLELRPAGGTQVLGSVRATLETGRKYTLIVSGSAASLSSAVVSVGADTGAAHPDRANIRVIAIAAARDASDSAHQAPVVPLDVYITEPGADLTGITPVTGVDANTPTYSTLFYFDPGSLEVRFTTAGTKLVVATSGPFEVQAGEVKAIAIQRLSGGGYTTSVIVEQ